MQVDKVYTEQDTKTYNVVADVFYLDKKKNKNFKECSVLVENPVHVRNDENQIIGSAVIYVENHVVIADITLDYSTPERLNIETKSMPVYPKMAYEAEGVAFKDEILFTKLIVKGIRLELTPNEDIQVSAL